MQNHSEIAEFLWKIAALIHECVTGQRQVPEAALTPALSRGEREKEPRIGERENVIEGTTHAL